MPDVAYTSERDEIFSFNKVSVLSSWSQVYAPKDSKIQSILDLNHKKVVVLEGSSQQESFKGLINGFDLELRIIGLKDYNSVFLAVLNKKADVAIANNFYGNLHARIMGLEDTGVVFNPSTLYFATKKNHNQELLTALDKNLKELKDTPHSAYYASLQKWTSENVEFELPLWIQLTIVFIVLILILSLIATYILKKQVIKRTRQLKKSYSEMELKVLERTADLANAMEKAQQADQIKSAFLATMSHELRTPLNSIIGFTGILLQGLAGSLNQEQHKQLSLVQKSARHLLSLINDVLDISKIESGQLDLDLADFNLKSSLEKAVKFINPIVSKKNVDLELSISADLDNIYGDQRRIEQIILNLLSNAAKFTEKGKISINAWLENHYCFISISDTGIGMASDDLDKLFLPFSQIDTGLSRKYEGTGLGLSICKKLIEIMQGNINVVSTLNQGSTFIIHFPYKKEI